MNTVSPIVIYDTFCMYFHLKFLFNFSLPRNFKYGVRGRSGSVKVVQINGAPTLSVNGKAIYTKPLTQPVGYNHMEIIDPNAKVSALGLGRINSENGTITTQQSRASHVSSKGLTDQNNGHVVIDIENRINSGDLQAETTDQNLIEELNEETYDNVFTVEAEVEPIPGKQCIPDIIVTSMECDNNDFENQKTQQKVLIYGRSISDSTNQTSSDIQRLESSEGEQSKSETDLNKTQLRPSFFKKLFSRKGSSKSKSPNNGMEAHARLSSSGFSTFLLPQPKSDFFVRSQSAEEPGHSNQEGLTEEDKAFSESEITFQTEMEIRRSPKRQNSYHCVSWNKLSESQKGEKVEIIVSNRLKRSQSEKPRMIKGMSIEHLDKVIIRRANSAYIEKRRRKSGMKFYSFHEKGSNADTNIPRSTVFPETGTILKRSVSDPCVTVSLIKSELENHNLATRHWNKSKKHGRQMKGKGHVSFVRFLDMSSTFQEHSLRDFSQQTNDDSDSHKKTKTWRK